jgi:hypothetical protein
MIIKWQKRFNGIRIWKTCQKRFNVENRTTTKNDARLGQKNDSKKWHNKIVIILCNFL